MIINGLSSLSWFVNQEYELENESREEPVSSFMVGIGLYGVGSFTDAELGISETEDVKGPIESAPIKFSKKPRKSADAEIIERNETVSESLRPQDRVDYTKFF